MGMRPDHHEMSLLAWSAGASAMLGLLGLATALVSRAVYDHVLPQAAVASLWVLVIGATIALAFDLTFRVLRQHIAEAASLRADRRHASEITRRILGARADSAVSSDLATQALAQHEAVSALWSSSVVFAVVDCLFGVIAFIAVAIFAGWLSIIPLLAGVASLASAWLIQKRIDATLRESARASCSRQRRLHEGVLGLSELRLARAQDRVAQEIDALTDMVSAAGARVKGLSALASSISATCSTAASIGLLAVGALSVIDGGVSMGQLIAASMLAGRITQPFLGLAGVAVQVGRAQAARNVLQPVLNATQETDREGLLRPTEVSGKIQFSGVTFVYPGCEIPALKNLSFDIQSGERVALLGRKGCGKSTIVRLLSGERLVEAPNTGLITLDGIGINHIHPDSLRSAIGVASQDPMMFSGTILENIRLARPDATDEEVLAAAKIACVHDWVAKLPKGYGTLVSERGMSLSGGERQLIALARMVLADPRVVVLDEPTSALDNETQGELMRRLVPWLDGRTVVVVTHRPELLSICQTGIMMQEGQVLAIAPAAEILHSLRTGVPLTIVKRAA